MVGSDTEYLTFVNKILGRWYKCQNAIVIDVKVLTFFKKILIGIMIVLFEM